MSNRIEIVDSWQSLMTSHFIFPPDAPSTAVHRHEHNNAATAAASSLVIHQPGNLSSLTGT